MPDLGKPPVSHSGEELRRVIAGRRQRRCRLAVFALILLTTVPLAASSLWKPPTMLVWNASASAPIGLYRVHSGEPIRRGDMVVARAPGGARALAAGRGYIPANVPLVKRAAAVAGDRICAAGTTVSINGRPVATRLRRDLAGRRMPWWRGCHKLRSGEYFLLMDSRMSFDGRYFGASGRSDILGWAELWWAKPADRSNDG